MTKRRFAILLAVCMLLSLINLPVTGRAAEVSDTITGASVDESDVSVTLYVDNKSPGASDSNPGTSLEMPLKTISRAAELAYENKKNGIGTKIVIKEGVYRETVVLNEDGKEYTAPIIFEGDGSDKVFIKASEVFEDAWVAEGDYYTHVWPYNFPIAGDIYADYGIFLPEVVRRTEMIFVNGKMYHQVLSKDELTPGTFYIDDDAKKAYIDLLPGTEIDTALIEVAERDMIFVLHNQKNVVIRGMTLQHGNGKYHGPTSLDMGDNENILVDDVNVEWNNGIGSSISRCYNVTLRGTRSNYNGINGFTGVNNRNFLFENCETSYNNWKGVIGSYTDWHNGGIKFLFSYDVKIVGHKAIDNFGPGIWFDSEIQNIIIRDSIITGNDSPMKSVLAGIYLEGGIGPFEVSGCIITDNKRGLNLASSNDITISDCIIANNTEHQIAVFSNYGVGRTFSAAFGGGDITSHLVNTTIKDTIIVAPDGTDKPFFYYDHQDTNAYPQWLQTLRTENVKYSHPKPSEAFLLANNWARGDLETWMGYTNPDDNAVWLNAFGFDILDYKHDGFVFDENGALEKNSDDVLPLDEEVKYSEKPTLRVNFTKQAGWFNTGIDLLPDSEHFDLTSHVDSGILQFAIKGESGGEQLKIGLRSAVGAGNQDAYVDVTAAEGWQTVQIPVKDLIAANGSFDTSTVYRLMMDGSHKGPQKLWLSDFKLLSENLEAPANEDEDEEPVVLYPHDLDILDYKYGGHVFDQYGVIEKIDESSTVPEDLRLPLDEEETYQGKPSVRVNYRAQAGWFNSSFNLLPDRELLDITPYLETGIFQFAVKGASGGEQLNIGFRAPGDRDALLNLVATTEWKIEQIPFKAIVAANQNLDPEEILAIIIEGSHKGPQTLWLADFKFLLPVPAEEEEPEPTESPEPTETAEPTESPEPTVSPEPTESPEPTVSPEPTESPEPTTSPEPTSTPDPSASPAPSVEPTSKPGSSPKTADRNIAVFFAAMAISLTALFVIVKKRERKSCK
jgi:parallel beta-helix repeat protein